MFTHVCPGSGRQDRGSRKPELGMEQADGLPWAPPAEVQRKLKADLLSVECSRTFADMIYSNCHLLLGN